MKKKILKQSIRLPNHTSPISYNLLIKPDLESFTFSGSEIIKIKIKKETNQITLHSKDIDIETVSISSKQKVVSSRGKSKDEIQFASKITYDIKSETSTFYFKNKIKSGNGKLHITFSGIINEGLRGLYKSKYILDGEEKYLATTQFEATDARRAFPCFDEPEHKATFEVSLVISDKHTAISNTLPIEIKEHSAGYKIVSFAPTPKMSTYLLAFIVGEFEYIERRANIQSGSSLPDKFSGPRTREDEGPDHENLSANAEPTLVRVFTTAGKKHQAKFALDVAIRSLEFYNEYFGIPYPLPTLDLIAIPDFESAAMENWGAVTFRESAILVDEEKTSLSNKQWVAIVIAHELAHQWFGNLVTMKWWTDLWLNEGFASYMENFCVDKMFPDWHIWDLYLADRYALALRLDSLSNSHPIEISVNHPDEINEIFDMVSYAKGSAMIRQLAEYIGHDNFRDGLRHYLKKHSYKNTDTVDLWNSFEKISKKPVNKIMSAWTKATGYPLITLSQRKDLWEIKQERFFSSRISAKKYKNSKTKKNLWPIPIRYESLSAQAGNGEIIKLLMTKKSDPLIGNSIGKINKEEETFMRVRYDDFTLQKLGGEIRGGSLSVRDRLGIIRDLFALVEGGYIKTHTALEFTLNYQAETEYIVWTEIAGGINRVYNLIHSETFAKKYETYARLIFSPLIKRMGFEKKKNLPRRTQVKAGEKHSDVFLRSLAISQSAFYGDKEIIKKAQELFKNKKSINADIRGVIYRIVALSGNEKEWKLFEGLYKKELLNEEKERFGYALASFRNEKLLQKTLNFIMSEHVKSQDAPHLLTMVWQNNYGRDLTWKFIKANWKIFLKKYGEGGHFLSRLISPLGNHTDLTTLKDAKKFFAKNNAPGADRTLEQAYEKIESNASWLKEDKKDIQNWLNKNY
ncbi:MAG: M1 family metallopeptidase [Candidatus Paceibacterota bacterium]|jgi:puromycin-sensitive aminopeptidase